MGTDKLAGVIENEKQKIMVIYYRPYYLNNINHLFYFKTNERHR